MAERRSLLQRIHELALPISEQMGLILVDEEFVKENGRAILRFVIDKEGGVTLDDCQQFSQAISPVLDAEDPIEQSYYLEVASPGLDRPLKKERDYQLFRGRLVRIKTYAPIDDQKVFIGKLQGLRDGEVYLELSEGDLLAIPLEKIAGARLHVEW